RVGVVMIVLFLALVAQVTYVQIVRSDSLNKNALNPRPFLRNAARDRGPIVSSDGVVLALSRPSSDEFKHQRVYPAPTAPLFTQVVGYQSIFFGEQGVESTYSDELAGRTFMLQTSNLADIFATRQPVGTVVLTLSKQIQQVAEEALAGRRG